MWYGEVDIMKSPTLSSNDSSAQLRSCDLGGIFVPSTRYSIRLRSNSNRWSIPRDIPDASRRRSTQVLIDPFKLAGKAWNEFLLGENSAASESFWLIVDQRALKISVWNRIRISLRLFFFSVASVPYLDSFALWPGANWSERKIKNKNKNWRSRGSAGISFC